MRKAIRDSGLTTYTVAKRAKIPVSVLQRFMSEKAKTLTLDTATKLADVVGIELRIVK
ncbi:MAG: helix-turn-helix domain-containing protein [Planctomycetes bacterium]|nr:helix-turn-helix domain-containing protein [Planctomycetota bacterium]